MSSIDLAKLHVAPNPPLLTMRQIPIRSLVVLLFFALGTLATRNDVRPLDWTLQTARRLGLAESVLDKAQRNAEPALHLEHAADQRFSWMGGLPTVPPGFEWPFWHGKPLTFVAQLDLAEVTTAFTTSWLPPHGQLYFFFADDAEESPGGYDSSDRGSWRVIYTDVEHSELTAAHAPPTLDTSRFPRIPVAFRPISSLPSEERLMGNWNVSDAESEALSNAELAPFRKQPRHQLFGLPIPEQDDQMELDVQRAASGMQIDSKRALHDSGIVAAAARWRLLLQVDSDDAAGMLWGDAGLLYFWIREEDATRRNFNDVWMIMQSG